MNIFKKFGIWSKAMSEIKHANIKEKAKFGRFLWREIDRTAEQQWAYAKIQEQMKK